MAIIYSYPTVLPTTDDLILGTDVNKAGNPTKNFTIGSVIDLVTAGAAGLGATIKLTTPLGDARDPVTFVNQPMINLSDVTGSGTLTFPGLSAGALNISGGNLTTTGNVVAGAVTATSLTGNLLSTGTAGQIASAVQAITQNAGDNSTKIATTAYVDGIVDPSVLTFLGTTGGDQTVNLVAQKLSLLGTANQIESVSAGQSITFNFPAAGVILPDGSSATTQATGNDTTLVATTAFVQQEITGQDLDFSGNAASTGQVDLDSQVFAITGTTNQTATTALNQGLSISLTPSVTISGTFTGATFAGDLNGTINTATTGTTQAANNDSTLIATTKYVDNASSAKTLDYAGDATGPFSLNLSTDDLEFNGDSNITVTAATVTATKGIVTIDLDNDVTITGTMQAGTLSDGTFSGTAGTYTGGVSITSTDFVGALTGNASTATALAAVGTMSIDGDFTTTIAPTYTSGGNQIITANMADTVVTGKVLTNLSTATAQTITATDTILEALGYLQSTVTGLPAGLDYIGTWDASGGGGGSPDLTVAATHVPGQYYICSADSPAAGTFPNGGAVGPSEWKVGDWCIRGDAQNDVWQKIDNTSIIDGTGTTDKIARWIGPQTLGTGLISDDGATVTIGNTGAFLVEGNSTFGNATTDTVLAKGPVTFDETLDIKKGIFVNGTQGTDGYVLTSGNGSGAAMSWAEPTVGTVTSVSATTTGDALDVAVTTATTTPAIALTWAGGATGATKYVNGLGNLTTFPTLDNYQYWTLSDDTTTVNISSTDTAKILGGTYITSVVSAADKSATLTHDTTTRTSGTSAVSPAFGATVTMFDDVQTNGTGHVTISNLKTVTLPSPVNFTPSPTSVDAGAAGYVPAPAAGTGSTSYFLNGTGAMSIPPNDDGVTAVTATAPISSTGGDTPVISHDASGVGVGTYDSVTVDIKGHVTAGSNPGGSGGGIFSGDQAIAFPPPTLGDKAFTLNRATTGTLIFDVWFTSETSTSTSVAKKYTVAHANNATPVYNKIIDTGPDGSNDFTVSFYNAGSGLSVECYIVAGTIAQNIGYTVQVGHDSANALTFTAAS